MNSNNFKLKIYGFLVFGLAVGAFVIQANAQQFGNSNQLTGSYQLDTSRSSNINTVIADVARQNKLSPANRRDLETKLSPSATVSIAINGRRVALTSSNSNPVTLNADGKVINAYGTNGTKVSIRTSLLNNALSVSSLYGKTNYSITFRPINNGSFLHVTRTVKTNYLRQPVIAESVYSRTSSSMINTANVINNNGFSNDKFIVPNGTVLKVVADTLISTKFSQNGDRFRLTVQSPDRFAASMIEGYLTGIERVNGVIGTAKVTLNFQKITLRNGQIYDFSGIVQGINDKELKNNNEGQIKGKNTTNESVRRGVIGAGVGAIIGAAIAGKKGALIGAAVGGGASTASVMLEGGNNLNFQRGTQMSIQSTSPK